MLSVVGFFGGWEGGFWREGRELFSEEWVFRAVMRVLITQIGLVISTVAEPAMAPASMDSIVVNFFEMRLLRIAARSKKARVHSYPEGS